MNENIPIENILNQKPKQFDRLPLGPRNRFQIVVFQKLGIGHNDEEVMKDRELISNYIDNAENHEVRDLIMGEKYDEAANLMIEKLKETGYLSKAA